MHHINLKVFHIVVGLHFSVANLTIKFGKCCHNSLILLLKWKIVQSAYKIILMHFEFVSANSSTNQCTHI